MNISQLQFFASVAQFENVSRAAEHLHISQSSLSKSIARLENELGVQLFDREGKHIKLNEAGIRFLKCCNTTLQEIELAALDIRKISSGNPNEIRICLCGGGDTLIPALAEFRTQHPDVEYSISDYAEGDEIPDINRYDVLLYPDDSRFQKWYGYDLRMEKALLAVPVSHPLAERDLIATEDLAGENLVFLRASSGMMENAFQVAMLAEVKFGACSVVESRMLHLQMISAGLGVGFVPENSVSVYRDCRSIRLIPISDKRYTHRMKICFRREKHLSALGRELCTFLKRYYRIPPEKADSKE